jgi:2-polyprenyl-3-methyl-5-hydroxy-6-metoxy-1,4-benzoquinol methylase
LRRIAHGLVLDIGCGIGRNLAHLDGSGVGIDHNESSVQVALARGLKAFTPAQFRLSEFNRGGFFDVMLLAHVLEHMPETEAVDLVRQYEALVKPDGRLILITPQEAGFRSDPTHVEFLSHPQLRRIAESAGFSVPIREYSFPFPRPVGRIFTYNEFVGVYHRH